MKLLLLFTLVFTIACSNSSSKSSGPARAEISEKLSGEYDKICNWINGSRLKDGEALVQSKHEINSSAQRLNCDASITLKGNCSAGQFALVFSRIQNEDHPRTFYSKSRRTVTLTLSRSAKPVLKLVGGSSAENHSIDSGKYKETVRSEEGNVEYSNFEFVDAGNLVLTIKLDGAVANRKDSSQVFYKDMPKEQKKEQLATLQFDSILTFDTQRDFISTQVSNLQQDRRGEAPSLKMTSMECRLLF